MWPFAIWIPGTYELVIIGLVALLLFGGRLVGLARHLGRGVGEIKSEVDEVKEDINDIKTEALGDLTESIQDTEIGQAYTTINQVSKAIRKKPFK